MAYNWVSDLAYPPLNWMSCLDDPYRGYCEAAVGDDMYRIWPLGNSRQSRGRWSGYELWFWDGPYTDMGGMGADLRSARNAHKLGHFRRLEHAKAAGAAFQRAREDDARSGDPILKSKAPFGTNDFGKDDAPSEEGP
jgi:hypothetical protein